MKRVSIPTGFLLVVVVFLFASCGGGSNESTPLNVTVAASPSFVALDQGATQQFTATVTGATNTNVVWSVLEANGGTISAQGVYTAPAVPGFFHVRATSAADGTKTATSDVSINSVSVSVQSAVHEMVPGEAHQFTATVSGTVNSGVIWSVQQGSSGGSVTADGVYTAPANAGTFHVIATSAADTSKTASIEVSVQSPVVIIRPRALLLAAGALRVLTASVSGTMDDSVIWTLQEPASGGAISSEGVYTAPQEKGEYHVIATSVVFPSVSGTATVTVGDSGFSSVGNMTQARFDHTAALLPNGDVLLAGGATYSDGFYPESKSAEIFDHTTNTFRLTGEMIDARVFHTATSLLNGKVLIAGGGKDDGFDYYYPIGSAEIYDPETEQFVATGNLQTPRINHTATLLQNGKVLLAGGYTAVGDLSSAELYDPETGTFTSTGSMSHARSWHTASLLADGRVLVMGGWESAGSEIPAEIYDPATGSFTTTASLQRDGHTATSLNDGRVLVAGGHTRDDYYNYTILDDAWLFDPASGQFSFAAQMNDRHFEQVATKLQNGEVLIVGGMQYLGMYETDNSAELFDPASSAFVPAGFMSAERVGFTATLLQDGRVLIAGGSGTASAEVYTPEP